MKSETQERDRHLCEWILNSPPTLTYPLQLYPWVRADSEIFLQRLQDDAMRLLAHLSGERDRPPPRAICGALQSDIEKLKAMEEDW